MQLHVMTCNIRVAAKIDGINFYPNREAKLMKAITDEDPDIIGFQEVSETYIRPSLFKHLSDRYTIVGCGREKGYRGEACPIAFRKDTFDLLSFSTIFLSSEPAIPGSRYAGSDQSNCPRLCVCAELVGKDGIPFRFFNTHLDHEGQTARLLGMNHILQHISRSDSNFILTGDMNALPDSPEIALPLAMTGRTVKEATAPVTHTFHAYGERKPDYKIDYIFTDGTPLEAYALSDPHEDGIWLSDHYPVCASIEL